MAVTLKGSYAVKPSEPTWHGVISLSIFDQIGSIAHEPIIYLYRQPPDNWQSPPDAIADALKNSLSRALAHFYPLAGRVRWSGEGGGRLELHCNAMGAEFSEAEADSELDHFFGNDFSPSKKFRHLIPDVDCKYKSVPLEEIPPLLVQLTRFACGGISLGVALSQVVADGTASVHFMSEWAGLARGEPLKTAPFLDRGVLRAGEPPRVSVPAGDTAAYYLPKLMIQKSKQHQDEIKMDKTSTAKLRLSKDEVEKLKKMANEGREESKIIARAYTRFEAMAAHVWRCVTKARNHEYPQQPTALTIPIDVRSRVQPPLPCNYFGVAVCDVHANSVAGELISRPLGYAASRIRAVIEKANSEFIWMTIDHLKSLSDLTWLQNLESHLDGTPSIKNPNLGVISWLTLPIYGLDFGWGKEIYMGPGEIEGEWSYLLPCPSGDGSIILVLCLQTAHMDSFKKHFYEDIV